MALSRGFHHPDQYLSATAGSDYLPVTKHRDLLPRAHQSRSTFRSLKTNFVEGTENISLVLRSYRPGDSRHQHAVLSIIDNDFNRGNLTFSALQYTVSEGVAQPRCTILRTNGNTGAIAWITTPPTAPPSRVQSFDATPAD